MEITGIGWAITIAFIIIVLLLFIWCCIIINNMYDDKGKK